MSTLVWGMLFGSIGMGYFLYGRKQRRAMPFIAGLGLMSFPYFVDGDVFIVLFGAMLIAAPFLLKF